MNYAGVTIDFYDDLGATVKAKFPDFSSVPDVVKTASIRDRDSLPNEAFALVAVDNGQVIRKLACYDPGTTAMSVMYFMEHGDKLPEDAVKIAAWNLTARCREFGLEPPAVMSRIASDQGSVKTASSQWRGVVDTTGQRPKSVVKVAKAAGDENYAVVDEGKKLYPIDTHERVKMAESHWLFHYPTMDPAVRRQFAVKLAARAVKLGIPLDEKIKEAGALTWAPPGVIRGAIEMRKLACSEEHHAVLDDLFEKRASFGPEVFAGVLNRFDKLTDLDNVWGTEIPDPWSSTYGLHKTADELLWEDGPDRLTKGELENLVNTKLGLIKKQFSSDLADGLMEDAVGVFKSLPTPHKQIIARMSADSSADGETEVDSEAPDPGEHKLAMVLQAIMAEGR